MKLPSLLAGVALAMTLVGGAQADTLSLGKPGYGGTGCPAGSTSVSLSPDGKALRLQFGKFSARTGGSASKAASRRACSLSIPVHVPQGVSVSVLAIDYRGHNEIPAGGTSVFSVEYFFTGSSGPEFTKTFTGPLSADYQISNTLTGSSSIWSACGADVILRANSSIRVTAPGSAKASASVGSQKVKAGIEFQLQWKAC